MIIDKKIMKVIDSNCYTHKYTIYQQFISNQFVKKLIPEWNWYKIYNKYFCIGCASLNLHIPEKLNV